MTTLQSTISNAPYRAMQRLRTYSLLVAGLLALPAATAAAQRRPDSLGVGTTVPIAPLSRTSTRSWGASVLVIDSAEIAQSTARTLSELLQATLPGVLVLRSGGTASDGSMVMIRGPISILSMSEPVLIVDGLRVDARQADNMVSLGAVSPSRLDDIAPEDIERIDVLPAAAGALFGEAAAGAIIVTTKRGESGALRLTGRVTASTEMARDEFPANYRRLGTVPTTGQPNADCTVWAVAAHTCTPTGLDVWNPLEQASPFRAGHSAVGHLALRGTVLGTGIYGSVSGYDREGVLPRDQSSRLGFRTRLTRDLPGGLAADVFGGYLHDEARMGMDGGYLLNSDVISNGLTGFAENDGNHGYRQIGGFPGDFYPDQWLSHVTGGVTLRWHLFSWLEASGTTGRDRVLERWAVDDFAPPGTQFVFDRRAKGSNELTTSGLQASATYRAGIARNTTTVGFERRVALSPAVSSNGFGSIFETETSSRSSSVFLLQSLELPRSLTFNVSLQRFARSIFGDSRGEWFPGANVSLPIAVGRSGLVALRWRAAYSEAPGAIPDAPTLLQLPRSPPLFATIEMERTKELETGVDASFGERASLSLTAFRSRATDVMGPELVVLPNGRENLLRGEIENRGVEGLLHMALVHAHGIAWDASLSVATLRNRVTELPVDAQSPFAVDFFQVGAPLSAVRAVPYTFSDANHDGIIDTAEVHLGTLSGVRSPLPTLQAGLGTALHLSKGLTITALADYEHGNTVVDQMGEYRCVGVRNCRGLQDPSAPLAEQAAAAAALKSSSLPVAGFVEDGSFLKVREVAVHWLVAGAWAHYVGGHAEITLAGRNLATATSYGGSDPEISTGPPSELPRREFARLPIPREFVLRIDFGT